MIKLIQLKHRWQDESPWILDIPYLEIALGESLALVGVSGCGKSTLLSILAGWTVPTQGEVWVGDVGLHLLNDQERSEWRLNNVAWQAKHVQFFDSLSLPENLASFYYLSSKSRSAHDFVFTQSHAQRMFTKLNLSKELLQQSPSDLSLGELQRFQLLKTLIQHAPLTLLDEPSSHLDHDHRQKLAQALFPKPDRDKQDRKTHDYLIIATHDLQLAQHCDQQLYLDQSILNQPAHHSQPQDSLPFFFQQQKVLAESENSTPKDIQFSLPKHGQSYFAWREFIAQKKLYFTLILASCLALLIPYFVSKQVSELQLDISIRSQQGSLIISALNSDYDLFFSSVYYQNKPQNELKTAQMDMLFAFGIKASPVVLAPPVNQQPLIGTDATYYRQRDLKFVQGRAPHKLGEVALSQQQAQELGLTLGEQVQTAPTHLFQLNAPYPINLKIVGLFHSPNRSDLYSYITTLATAWAARGYAHSHQKVSGQANASLVIKQDLPTADFHLHADLDQLPISFLMLSDLNEKQKSLLRARLRKEHKDVSILDPQQFSKQALNFTQEIHSKLKPLFNLAAYLSLALILMMLGIHYQARQSQRQQLLMLGLKQRTLYKLSLLEYGFFIIFGLLFFMLGLAVLQLPQWTSFTWIQALL